MASINSLPIDGKGVCMLCKKTPSQEKIVTCITCVTPWHMDYLENPPVRLPSVVNFECPDCVGTGLEGVTVLPPTSAGGDLVAKIREIEVDPSMTEEEKARRRQEIVSGKQIRINENEEDEGKEKDVLSVLGESIKCPFCYVLPDRPVTVTMSRGHNFCLKCFKKWIGQGKDTCVKCRSQINRQMINQPRINLVLVIAIRLAKESRKNVALRRPQFILREGAAKKAGMANASSGRIFVTIPSDHFGPILAENDPERNQGVLVGESWRHRLNCRQWGVHWPHVAGIARQEKYGAQSVVRSRGYEDDEDHGEWFLYTGSGGE